MFSEILTSFIIISAILSNLALFFMKKPYFALLATCANLLLFIAAADTYYITYGTEGIITMKLNLDALGYIAGGLSLLSIVMIPVTVFQQSIELKGER